MPLSLITNTASLNAQAALSKTSMGLSTTMSRLSTGLRIPNQQDALAQALAARSARTPTNESNAIAFAQTLDGGLSETTNILHRMRDLATQSLNDTLTASDRETLGNEFSKLKSAALNIAGGTTFNNEDWLTVNSGGAKSVAVGDAQLHQRQVALVSNGDAADGILTRSHGGISFSSEAFNISGSSTTEQRQNVLKALDQVISDTGTARYALGSFQGEVAAEVSKRAETDLGLYTPTVPSAGVDAANLALGDIRTSMAQQILSQANSLPQMAAALLRGRG